MKQKQILKELLNSLDTTSTYNNICYPSKVYEFKFLVDKKLAKELFNLIMANKFK